MEVVQWYIVFPHKIAISLCHACLELGSLALVSHIVRSSVMRLHSRVPAFFPTTFCGANPSIAGTACFSQSLLGAKIFVQLLISVFSFREKSACKAKKWSTLYGMAHLG